MEFNLPQWLFGWYQLLFMAYVAVAVVPTAVMIAGNNDKALSEKPTLFFHILGKVGLDIALVMGVSGTAVALMAGTISDNHVSDAYLQSTYIVGTMLIGAYLTGISFCFTYPQMPVRIEYQISRTQFLLVVGLIFTLMLLQAFVFGLEFQSLWTAGWALGFQVAGTIFLAVAGTFSGKPVIRCCIEANVAATFIWMALGVVFWFSEGGSYLDSRSNIFVIARTLFIGCIAHVVLYMVSLLYNVSSEGNYTQKTWHFAEAASFFIFLVLAPVGLTEFARESADLEIQRTNNVAQQQEINELKATLDAMEKEKFFRNQ